MLRRLASALWSRLRPSRRAVVLGGDMAQAQRAGEARPPDLKAAPGPLPPNLRYDVWRGDLELSEPAELPLDAELRTLCQRFEAGDAPTRSQIRDAASMDDFYTLLTFSRRSAVFAMRQRKREHVRDGLGALAIIDLSRIDDRDALVALGLLHHSARVIKEQGDELFKTAASLAEPKMSEQIAGFLNRPQDARDVLQWGHVMLQTKSGPGFVGWDGQPYEPTYALDQIAFALAQLVKDDRYGGVSVTLASALPAVWLSSADDEALKTALGTVRAAATIQARLRPQEAANAEQQSLMMFVAELGEQAASQSLLKLAQEKQTRPNEFALTAVKEGRLFCLGIGRSDAAGTACVETQDGFQRFAGGMAQVLKSHRHPFVGEMRY